MKPLSRRSVTTGLAAAVTAIPAVGLATSAVANPGDDKLLAVIGRYKAEVVQLMPHTKALATRRETHGSIVLMQFSPKLPVFPR